MRVYVTKEFARFARKAGLTNAKLLLAAADAAIGNHDADLGGGMFKQRIAREGGGKSGGFRTIILFRLGGHSFFVHGFAKNEKANVTSKEVKALKRFAELLFGLSERDLMTAQARGELVEVMCHDGDNEEV